MNNSTHSHLKIDLQKRIGLAIVKPIHVKLLQEAIENTTKETVGFNTLRRLFGFLEETSPNRNTLNVLSVFLGYKSYSDYKKNYLKDNEWFIWMKMIVIEGRKTISEDDFLWLQTQISTQDYHLKIASIIKAYVYKQNFKALNQIFDSRLFIIEEHDKNKLSLNICLLFQNLSVQKNKLVMKHIVKNTVFRENILHWFIDYSYFNGYYGAFIEEALKHTIKGDSEELFCELIINYTSYLSGKTTLNLIPIERIEDSYYDVLKSRCYAYNLIYFNHHNDRLAYKKTWSVFLQNINAINRINLYTLEIIPALIILKDFEKISYLIATYYEELLDFDNWSSHNVQSNVLMAYIITLLKEKKIKEANKSLSSVNLSRVNPSYHNYNKIFYLIIKYHIGVVEKIPITQLYHIEIEYSNLIDKMGFHKFSVNFLKNYFVT